MSHSRLDDFLTALARDQPTRSAYLADPASAMVCARLSREEQEVLRLGRLETILDYLDGEACRPSSPDRQLGSGTGGGSSGNAPAA